MTTVDDLIQQRPGFAAMAPANMASADRDKPIDLGHNIWMSPGTSNAYMVVTKAGRIIINTGMGFEALTHKRLFDAICPGPTPFIILTQGHVDHVGGVAHFRETNTVVIAQQNNAQCQRDDERIQPVRSSQAYIWFQPTIDSAIAIAKDHPEVFVQSKPVPDVTFDDRYTFTLDGMTFELLATPGGETIDSCVLWMAKEKILFSGNVFGPLFPHFPNINTIRGDKYRSMENYLESLRRVRALEAEVLITGHFEPIVGKQLIRDCLDRLEAAVQFIHTQTLKGMNAGKDIFTLMQEVQLPTHLQVGEGYGKVSWAVRTIWESYMGWFKAKNTSELYATQVKAAYIELVKLSGIQNVLACAQQKLSSNDIETALLLCEATLAAEPKHQSALQLSLDCHRALLARAGDSNFWESGWLKSQIAKIQKQL